MSSLDSSIKDAELRSTKHFKHEKQAKLKEILNNQDEMQKLPAKSKVRTKEKLNDNLNTLVELYADRLNYDYDELSLNLVFKNGETKLSPDSKIQLNHLKLLKELGFGFTNHVKIKLNKNPTNNKAGKIYYQLHLTNNFHEAMSHMFNKLHLTHKVKLCHIDYGFSVYLDKLTHYLDKHPCKSETISLPIALVMTVILGILVHPYIAAPLNSMLGIVIMIYIGVGLMALIALVGAIGLFLLGMAINMMYEQDSISIKLKKHNTRLARAFCKYSPKKSSEVLDILGNFKGLHEKIHHNNN